MNNGDKPASPATLQTGVRRTPGGEGYVAEVDAVWENFSGLTKREAFAMAAMKGMLAGKTNPGDIFASAVELAEGLLKALDNKEEQV